MAQDPASPAAADLESLASLADIPQVEPRLDQAAVTALLLTVARAESLVAEEALAVLTTSARQASLEAAATRTKKLVVPQAQVPMVVAMIVTVLPPHIVARPASLAAVRAVSLAVET